MAGSSLTRSSIRNTAGLRNYNTKLILDAMRKHDSMTKKSLASALDLSFATVSLICNSLLDSGILLAAGSESSAGGRIPTLMALNEQACPVISLNLLQSGSCAVSILNLRGKSLAAGSVDAGRASSAGELFDLCYGCARDLLSGLGLTTADCSGVGAAAPGIFDRSSERLVNSTNPLFEGEPLEALLSERFGLPSHVENESNLLAIGASMDGLRGGVLRDLIYLYIGEGLGVGIVSDGRLLVGHHGLGAEIEHMPIGFRNYPCHCGTGPCAEPELVKRGFLMKYGSAGQTEEDWLAFVEAVQRREGKALAVIEENARLIGTLLSVMANIFDPELIYIAGVVEDIYAPMAVPVEEELGRRLIPGHKEKIPIILDHDYRGRLSEGCAEFVFSSTSVWPDVRLHTDGHGSSAGGLHEQVRGRE